LRQQELSELEQASAELLKALERARQRTIRKPVGPILPQHFDDIIRAMRFVGNSLETLCDAHPGDSPQVLMDLIQERSGLSGWENWVALVQEQLDIEHRDLQSGTRPHNGISSSDERAAFTR